MQALRLCTGRTAHRGSRGIALPFHDHSTRRGLGVSLTPRPLFTPEKDPVPIVQEAGWAPGPVWTGAENLAPTGIRSSDGPARIQSSSNNEAPKMVDPLIPWAKWLRKSRAKGSISLRAFLYLKTETEQVSETSCLIKN